MGLYQLAHMYPHAHDQIRRPFIATHAGKHFGNAHEEAPSTSGATRTGTRFPDPGNSGAQKEADETTRVRERKRTAPLTKM